MSANPENEKELLTTQAHAQPMAKSRVVLVLVLLIALLGGHGVCVALKHEFWPLSHYPMYSKRHWNTWKNELMVGVVAGDPTQEIPISEFAFDRPISVRHSIQKINRSIKDDPSQREILRQVVLGLGEKYQELEGGNRPETYQKLDAVRLYLVTWRIVEKDGVHTAEEFDRELIMEVNLDESSGQQGRARS